MTADQLRSWFGVGREVLGFIRDGVALLKEARQEREERKKKPEEKKEEKK